MQAGITIKGLGKLLKKVKQFEPKLQKKIVRKALRAGAKVIRQAARAIVPVESGFLKSKVKVRAMKRSRRAIGINVQVSEQDYTGKAYYGSFVEYGTEKMEAKHPLKDACQAAEDRATAAVMAALKKGIREAK